MITSRERVLAALRHEEPDRVPIDLGSHASSTIAVLAYMRLRAHLNLAQDELPKMYNTWGQYCDVQEEILDYLGCDVVPLAPRHFVVFDFQRRRMEGMDARRWEQVPRAGRIHSQAKQRRRLGVVRRRPDDRPHAGRRQARLHAVLGADARRAHEGEDRRRASPARTTTSSAASRHRTAK